MNGIGKESVDHSKRWRHRALLVACVLIVAAGSVAGAILMPQEMKRRATQPPEPSHSPFHRRPSTPIPHQPFLRGVCWEGAGEIDSTRLDPLTRVHASWISQTPFGWQQDPAAP